MTSYQIQIDICHIIMRQKIAFKLLITILDYLISSLLHCTYS